MCLPNAAKIHVTLSISITRCVGHNTDLISNNNISKTARVNTDSFDQLSIDIQVDTLCTSGSLVIDVQSLWNYWNLKNRVVQFFRY